VVHNKGTWTVPRLILIEHGKKELSIRATGGYRMEQEIEDEQLDIASRLFDALRARLPDQPITLVDGYGRVVVSSDQSNTSFSPSSH
jgi:hypothetical protein